MYSVVGAGKEYIQTLVKWMAALFYTTPVHHPDQNFLHSIVDGEYWMMGSCSRVIVNI